MLCFAGTGSGKTVNVFYMHITLVLLTLYALDHNYVCEYVITILLLVNHVIYVIIGFFKHLTVFFDAEYFG